MSVANYAHVSAFDGIIRRVWPDHDFRSIVCANVDESVVLVWPRSDPARISAFNGFVGEWAVEETTPQAIEGFRRGFQAAVDAVPA